MERTLFLIFNHEPTKTQCNDAQCSLGADSIVDLPARLKKMWRQIPPDVADISDVVETVADWLKSQARPSDCVLIQGDFGAVYRMVSIALDLGLVPVYSTTWRQAEECRGADGTVEITHRFRHVRFRRYVSQNGKDSRL